MIQINDPLIFFKNQERFCRIPFTQSRGWYEYLKTKGDNIVFFADTENDIKIGCWGTEHYIPLTRKKILLIEGECYSSELNEKAIKSFYTGLSNLPYSGIEINSNNIYYIDFEIGIRRAGFIRPLSFHSCPLSIELSFNSNLKFDRNWIRNVKKANESSLSFIEVKELSDVLVESIVRMFKEMAELKKLRYRLQKEPLKQLLSSRDIRTFIVKNRENELIAARIVHEHKEHLSDVYAANSMYARECGATYFLLNSMLKLFKEEKKELFDFGRIPPSNHSTDSIYIFKNASRGRKVQYNGEWVSYKSKNIELLMFLYKHFILRRQRY